MKKCGIYRIYCRKNKKYYVGSSISITNRWQQHRYSLNNNKHTSPYLQNAWNKYGESAFTFKVLEECSKDVLHEREQYWIDKLQPKFNFVTAYPRREWSEEMKTKVRGVPRKPHSAETRAKLSAAAQARREQASAIMKLIAAKRAPDYYDKMLAASHTPEVRFKIGKANQGKPLHRVGYHHTAETKSKISAANTGNTYNLGKKRDPEVGAKISAALRAKYKLTKNTDSTTP